METEGQDIFSGLSEAQKLPQRWPLHADIPANGS
jgi:hypothetical protein